MSSENTLTLDRADVTKALRCLDARGELPKQVSYGEGALGRKKATPAIRADASLLYESHRTITLSSRTPLTEVIATLNPAPPLSPLSGLQDSRFWEYFDVVYAGSINQDLATYATPFYAPAVKSLFAMLHADAHAGNVLVPETATAEEDETRTPFGWSKERYKARRAVKQFSDCEDADYHTT